MQGDSSSRFFISNKAKISRLKISGMMGAEQDFVDENKINVIQNSLSEGWKVEDIPKIANNIRGGSFNRGANTALGGSEVKIIARMFQNAKIDTIPCGTTHGLQVALTKGNYQEYLGRYILGKKVSESIESLEKLIGSDVIFRSPAYCISTKTDICEHCLGDITASSKVGLAGQLTSTISNFTQLFLSLAHGTMLSLCEYDYKARIT